LYCFSFYARPGDFAIYQILGDLPLNFMFHRVHSFSDVVLALAPRERNGYLYNNGACIHLIFSSRWDEVHRYSTRSNCSIKEVLPNFLMHMISIHTISSIYSERPWMYIHDLIRCESYDLFHPAREEYPFESILLNKRCIKSCYTGKCFRRKFLVRTSFWKVVHNQRSDSFWVLLG